MSQSMIAACASELRFSWRVFVLEIVDSSLFSKIRTNFVVYSAPCPITPLWPQFVKGKARPGRKKYLRLPFGYCFANHSLLRVSSRPVWRHFGALYPTPFEGLQIAGDRQSGSTRFVAERR